MKDKTATGGARRVRIEASIKESRSILEQRVPESAINAFRDRTRVRCTHTCAQFRARTCCGIDPPCCRGQFQPRTLVHPVRPFLSFLAAAIKTPTPRFTCYAKPPLCAPTPPRPPLTLSVFCFRGASADKACSRLSGTPPFSASFDPLGPSLTIF